MSLEDDERLVSRVLDGDHDALNELIAAYRPLIFAILIRHMYLTRDDADEVFQRFLIHVWENDFRRLRAWSRKAPLSSYLARVARNLAGDFRREQLRDARAAYWAWARNVGIAPEPREILDTALAGLSVRDRELIRRRYVLGQTHKEIAHDLGMTPNHAGTALSRALFRLKQVLARKNV